MNKKRIQILLTCLALLTGFAYWSGAFKFDYLEEVLVSQPEPLVYLLGQVKVVEPFQEVEFQNPLELREIPDTDNRFVVAQQEGVIKAFQQSPQEPNEKIWLDLSSKLGRADQEMGLLGLALDPKFTDNKTFFVNYTADSPLRTVISRFVLDPETEKADLNQEFVILEILQPAGNHNGGKIEFGPDGYLYIGMGDGGKSGDPQNNAQNLNTLLGAMLRIDVSQTSAAEPYKIPPDNPLVGNPDGFKEEIWAWGLRNPWRYSFDRQTGDLWAGDVGQNAREEIDLLEKGKNYGWSIFEGHERYNTSLLPSGDEVPPKLDYTRDQGQCVTGGYVYRGKDLPAKLQGQYLFADFVTGTIWTVDRNSPKLRPLLELGQNIASFAEDSDGEIYLLVYPDKVYRLVSPDSKGPGDN